MKDLSKFMQKAQEMQAKMADAQAAMDDIEATGSAGAGLVKVTLRGNARAMTGLEIDPSVLNEEKAFLEDLILAAHADASKSLEQALQGAMENATKSLSGMIPGFKMPF